MTVCRTNFFKNYLFSAAAASWARKLQLLCKLYKKIASTLQFQTPCSQTNHDYYFTANYFSIYQKKIPYVMLFKWQ